MINKERTSASKTGFIRNNGLEDVAVAYAEILCTAGTDFRKNTDFLTLPSGEKVSSLVAANGVTTTGFNYSVFFGNSIKIETTREFQEKVVDGNFTRVGVACVSGVDGSHVTVIVYDEMPVY